MREIKRKREGGSQEEAEEADFYEFKLFQFHIANPISQIIH
jgi:hypothetical protein